MKKNIVFICALFLYLMSGYFAYSYFSTSQITPTSSSPSTTTDAYAPPDQNQEEEFSGPKTEQCPINGEMLTTQHKKQWEKRRPLVVMIENHVDARPQSGLTSADVVYEAVAEGGITRFAAVFYCKDAVYVGPVRSARVYFVDFAAEYGENPLYVHVGGANTPGPADALGKLSKFKWSLYNDLNQFAIPFPYFWRDYDRLPERVTEHTMYSSTAKLWDYAAEKRGLSNVDEDDRSWDENFTSWIFKKDNPGGNVKEISLYFWEGKSAYDVRWVYDIKTNTYKRFHDSAHKDNNNGKQIAAKNIIVTFMTESSANDGYPGGHLLYKTTGSGKAIVFRDGEAIEGVWQKSSATDRMRFVAGGSDIELNGGLTFVEVIPEGNTVEY